MDWVGGKHHARISKLMRDEEAVGQGGEDHLMMTLSTMKVLSSQGSNLQLRLLLVVTKAGVVKWSRILDLKDKKN